MRSNIPSLDLHGEYREQAILLVKEFITDQIILQNEFVCIIHGIGKDILRKALYEYLKHEKNVVSYRLDFMNPGCTILKLKVGGSNE